MSEPQAGRIAPGGSGNPAYDDDENEPLDPDIDMANLPEDVEAEIRAIYGDTVVDNVIAAHRQAR